jgi:hypothetical protein
MEIAARCCFLVDVITPHSLNLSHQSGKETPRNKINLVLHRARLTMVTEVTHHGSIKGGFKRLEELCYQNNSVKSP